jgi:putative molybdopterin biosynthesis protein
MQQVTSAPERLLTAEDVGAILGRHPRTIHVLARSGELASVRIGRRGVRFRRADVEAFIDRHVVGAGPT